MWLRRYLLELPHPYPSGPGPRLQGLPVGWARALPGPAAPISRRGPLSPSCCTLPYPAWPATHAHLPAPPETTQLFDTFEGALEKHSDMQWNIFFLCFHLFERMGTGLLN